MKKKKETFRFFKNLKYFGEFFKDKSVNFFEKFKICIFILLSIIYFFIPIDIIPDIFFGMGWIEDAGIIIAVLVYINERIEIYKNFKMQNTDTSDRIIDVDFKEVKKNREN